MHQIITHILATEVFKAKNTLSTQIKNEITGQKKQQNFPEQTDLTTVYVN